MFPSTPLRERKKKEENNVECGMPGAASPGHFDRLSGRAVFGAKMGYLPKSL